VLKKDVPHGKMYETLPKTQPLEMVLRLPITIPGIAVPTAGPIFPATFDSDLLKIFHENPPVISHEHFQHARAYGTFYVFMFF
jgi:hypothetical protein